MSQSNPHPAPQNEKKKDAPKKSPPQKTNNGAPEAGGMLPDQEPGVIPRPRHGQPSLTEVEKERADWEGMTPNKPSTMPEE